MASYSSYLNSHKNNLQNCCKPGSVGAQGPRGQVLDFGYFNIKPE